MPVILRTSPPDYSPAHVRGSTKLRFKIYPGYLEDSYLKVDTPSTYRVGISRPLAYLTFISITGSVPFWYECGIDYNFLQSEVEKVKTIFTTERFNDTELDGCAMTVQLFYLLGRLDELNTSEIAEKIKSYQIADGGFLAFGSGWADPFSSIYQTWWAVQALALLGEKPTNCSGVQAFVASMQDTTSPYETYRYEFKRTFQDGGGLQETMVAFLIAKTLGFELPHLQELQAKVEKEYAFFLANYTEHDLEWRIIKLYHLTNRLYMLDNSSRVEEMRHTLVPIAWDIHNALPEDDFFLRYVIGGEANHQTFLHHSLLHLERAAPKLDCYFQPNRLNATSNETAGELVVVNSSPLRYPLNLTRLEVLGEGKEHYAVTLTDGLPSFTLLPQEERHLPLVVTRTSQATGPPPPATIEVKLTLKAPIYMVLRDRFDQQPLTAQYYFTINVTQEATPSEPQPEPTSPTGGSGAGNRKYLALASSLGAATMLGTAVALMTREKERKKKKDL